MANPFKEAEKAKKKAPGSKQEHDVHEVKEEVVVKAAPVEETPVQPEPVQEKPAVQPEPVAEQPVVVPETKPAGKTEKKPAKQEKPALDIFAKLESEKKPSVKTYAFYLSDDNVEKLKKMAEKKKISASKLLDHILSEVL